MSSVSKKLKDAFKLYQALLGVIMKVNSSNSHITIYCGKKLYNTITDSGSSQLKNNATFVLDPDRKNHEYGYTKLSDLKADVNTFFND